jgi:uncharacterized protein (DUF2384 family)
MPPSAPSQPAFPLPLSGEAVLTQEDLARLSGPGIRAFFAIAERWQLGVEDQMALLDLDARSTFFQWRKAAPAKLNRDRLERISHVLGIYKALRILFPLDAAADAWVKKPNQALLLGGKPALALMTTGGITGLAAVRNYLDAQRGGWA